MAFDAADGSGTVSGYYPGYNAKNGTHAAINALGKPSIHITDNLTQYEWRCTGTSSLILAAYDNQQIKKVNGDYCMQSNCVPYAIDFTATSKAANAYDQADKFYGVEIRQHAFNLFAKPYNDFFHTNVTSYEQLSADMENRRKQFFVNLANCTKGTFNYAFRTMENDILYVEPTINGTQNGKCILTIQVKQANIFANCEIPMNNLPIFSKAHPTDANFALFYSSPPESDADKVISTHCKLKTN